MQWWLNIWMQTDFQQMYKYWLYVGTVITHSLEKHRISLYSSSSWYKIIELLSSTAKIILFLRQWSQIQWEEEKTHQPFQKFHKTLNYFINIGDLNPVTETFWDYTSNMFTQYSTTSLKQITAAGKFTSALLNCKKCFKHQCFSDMMWQLPDIQKCFNNDCFFVL